MPYTNPKQLVSCTSSSKHNITSKTTADFPLENLIFLGTIKSYFNKQEYLKIKLQANRAIERKKIFVIYGDCEPVRRALNIRGWIEQLPVARNQVNLATLKQNKISQSALERILLSNFVAKVAPNFVWNTREDLNLEEKHKFFKGKFNRLEISHLWATKQGLCAALKNECWFYNENVAEVNSPRTYACNEKIDLNDLKIDFKLTACSSLLKWFVSMVENKVPVFRGSGNVAINVIVFAINRCKEYIFRKQNKDIDKQVLSRVSNGQWNAFLKNCNTLVERRDKFKTDKDNKIPLFFKYARFLLQEMHKYRPELSCEGYHNIWIIKPAHCNRGWGIKLTSKLGVLIDSTSKGKYIAQKYIEEPLLIYDTKFDIRQYYLVTSACPLEIWMYKDCYLKFSSQKYSITDYHESIHLTNNAVQKKYENCKDRHSKLPPHNMWHSDTFKDYLMKFGKEDAWDTIIYPGMKKSIVAVMTSCQDSITHCVKNRFELYGCDFILDKSYRPWLIEINSSPDFKSTTPVTKNICPEVLFDVIKVVVDYADNSSHPTGRFERIHRQAYCPPYIDAETDQKLRVRGHALPFEYFYRGNRQLVETNSLSSIAKQEDVSAILKALRMVHDEDIIKESNDNSFYLAECQRNIPTNVDVQSVQSFCSGDVHGLIASISDSEQMDSRESVRLSVEPVTTRISLARQVFVKDTSYRKKLCFESSSTPIPLTSPVFAQVMPADNNPCARKTELNLKTSIKLSETMPKQRTDINSITKSVDDGPVFSEYEKVFDNRQVKKCFLNTGTGVVSPSNKQNKSLTSLAPKDNNSKIRFTAEEGDERFIQIKNKLYSLLNKLDQN